jgi:hypothetical protein
LKGAYNFVPGVMAMVLLLVCTMMTAITIVREKKWAPWRSLVIAYETTVGGVCKAVPYLLLSTINIASILLLSVYVLKYRSTEVWHYWLQKVFYLHWYRYRLVIDLFCSGITTKRPCLFHSLRCFANSYVEWFYVSH